MQPFFYALRPVMVYPKTPGIKEFINYAAVIGFSSWLGLTYGMNCVYYLLLSDWLGLGLHPISGHFISEHYEFVKDQETYSYYGPLNYLTWNVGYHNEHHDFPRISGFRLPQVL
jgi:sphingolipid delta-4 desaturase